MLDAENKDLCWAVLTRYGIRNQRMMMVEECAELQKAVCKMFREMTNEHMENYREEVIDVIVMAQQIILSERISMDEVNKIAREKLKRALENEH